MARSGMFLILLWAAVAPGATGQEAKPPVPAVLVVRAGTVVRVNDAPLGDGQIVLADGRIKAVGARGAVDGPAVETIDLGAAVLYPGFIDASTWAAIRRERDDTTRAFQPKLRMVDAFDPRHAYFAQAAAAGVTSVHLVPGDRDVIGGRSAVVKVGPDGRWRALVAEAGMKLSLDERDYVEGRAPTSLLGAVSQLRHPPADVAEAILPYRAGSKPVYTAARTDREMGVTAALKAEFGFKVVLCADLGCGKFAARLAQTTAGVILEPIVPNRRAFEIDGLRDLAATELPLAFGSYGAPAGAAAVTFSAIAAARAGLSEERIVRALTIDAARLLGAADRIGSLEAGKDADLVALSAPVIDPRAKVLLVVQDGVVIYRAPKAGETRK